MWTVLGSSGFIGSHVLVALRQKGITTYAPDRDELANLYNRQLGKLVYCIGATSDFREKTAETYEAHVSLLHRIITCNFCDDVVYLSSTRVYRGRKNTEEDSVLSVTSADKEDVYAISKLAGESFLLHSGVPAKIIRLSNVYSPATPDFGSGNFLDSIITEAALYGHVTFHTSPLSEKDFIHISDVVEYIFSIADSRESGIFNLAGGRNTSNAAIGEALVAEGISIDFSPSAPEWRFPEINITKLSKTFGKPNYVLLQDLPIMLDRYRLHVRDTEAKEN